MGVGWKASGVEVSLGEMGEGSASPPKGSLRRRVSFDEVLVMQHMAPRPEIGPILSLFAMKTAGVWRRIVLRA